MNAHQDDKLDIHDGSAYISRMWLYIFCGLLDSMWQTTAYWLMGAMSNDPAKLANFSGFCACFVSARFVRLGRLTVRSFDCLLLAYLACLFFSFPSMWRGLPLRRQVAPVGRCGRGMEGRRCRDPVSVVL